MFSRFRIMVLALIACSFVGSSMQAGKLICKNYLNENISLTYRVGEYKEEGMVYIFKGYKDRAIELGARKSTTIDLAPFQEMTSFKLFSADFQLLWKGVDVAHVAHKYLIEDFARHNGIDFFCKGQCCALLCQIPVLAKLFHVQGKQLNPAMQAYEQHLGRVDVILEFSRDGLGNKVTTKIGNFTQETRIK